jgi:hypothetical protein
MFRKKRCYNGGNKHNFQPRYDEKFNPTKFRGEGYDISDLQKLFTDYTYVKDVCVWCGKEIKRKEAT